MGLQVWIFLYYICFAEEALTRRGIPSDISLKILYPAMVMVVIYIWILAATGTYGEIRWWPSRDRLSRLVPPSIKKMTMTKCRWTLLLYQS